MQLSTHIKMNCVSLLLAALCIARAGGISVKWGTSGGPIVPPPPPPPSVAPQPPFRAPAPAWEDQSGDIPNPNPYRVPIPPQLAYYYTTKAPPAQVPSSTLPPPARPPVLHTRYTHVIYSPKPDQPSTTTLSPAKAFVNAYAQPTRAPAPSAQPQNTNNVPAKNPHDTYDNEINYQNLETRSDNGYVSDNFRVPQLGVRYIPGYGYKYFTPEQDNDPRKYDKSYKYNIHNKHNALESNDVFGGRQHQNDLELSYEKQMALRVKKSPSQLYVPQQPFTYYNQQLFFPANFLRH